MNLEKVILKKDLIKDIKSISYLYESAGWFRKIRRGI